MRGALEGVRVIDASQHMAGPLCGQKLGDLGADVIKVEPVQGEWSRSRAIYGQWLGDVNTSFASLNRNKRGITLNLKDERGLEVLYRLVRDADVFLTNFRPPVLQRLKVDYGTLSAMNRRLVYCSISGYGEDGPYRDRPGQDLLVQALSGLTWNVGSRHDPPIPAGAFLSDASAGSIATIGILAALLHRERTGEGQKVEVDLLSSVLEIQIQELTTYANTGFLPERTDERLGHTWANTPYGLHRTHDGYIAVTMASFDALADALDCEELRIGDWDAGYAKRDEVFRTVADRLRTKTTAEWMQILGAHGIWCGPVLSYPEVVQDPQVGSLGVLHRHKEPGKGSITYVAFPARFSVTPATIRSHPPLLGEHTAEILKELGFTDQDLAELRREGVTT